jgi:hypothetical protein
VIHIIAHVGAVPLCGRSLWEDLTTNPENNECWECASIAGAYSPELQERFGVNADGSERLGPLDSDGTFTEDDQGNWHEVRP